MNFAAVGCGLIEQPDGIMGLVPEWMTSPAAAAVEIRETPHFPLSELQALRQVVVAVLSLPSDRGNGDRHGTLHTPRSAGAFPENGSTDVTAASGDRASGASRRTAVEGDSGRRARDGATKDDVQRLDKKLAETLKLMAVGAVGAQTFILSAALYGLLHYQAR
jgi:hypothetical protein